MKYHCEKCGKFKYEMDMHSKTQCKICWSNEYEKKLNIGKKIWKTRYERYGPCGHKGYRLGKKVKAKAGKDYY